jgi:hypothetical protein
LLVGHDDVAVVVLRDMLEVVESEPRHTILVRDHQSRYLAALDRVHDRHERPASQVHSKYRCPVGPRRAWIRPSRSRQRIVLADRPTRFANSPIQH